MDSPTSSHLFLSPPHTTERLPFFYGSPSRVFGKRLFAILRERGSSLKGAAQEAVAYFWQYRGPDADSVVGGQQAYGTLFFGNLVLMMSREGNTITLENIFDRSDFDPPPPSAPSPGEAPKPPRYQRVAKTKRTRRSGFRTKDMAAVGPFGKNRMTPIPRTYVAIGWKLKPLTRIVLKIFGYLSFSKNDCPI